MRQIIPTALTSAFKASDRPKCVSCERRPAVVILARRSYCGACAIRLFDPPYQSERQRQKLTLTDILNGHR